MGGGIGSRFWPFSRETFPKQFLDFFGEGRSLLQQTYDRFARIIPQENILIVTNERYAALVKQQLPQLDDSQILLEPQRRNTAPCIAYAAYHIKARNPEATMVVAPSDHLIRKEDKFIEAVAEGLDFVNDNDRLLTLGVRPSRPETGYGYIQSSETAKKGFLKAKTFIEKPQYELAKVFMESGEFFWNAGIFLWNVKSIINAFNKYLPDIAARFELGADKFNTPEEQTFINTHFPFCQNISIDYGIMEKADNVYIECVDFGWADLGTWGSLYDIAHKDVNGNAVLNSRAQLYDSANNIVSLGDPDRLAVVSGLDGYIVAECNNVLLICRRDDEQRIKQFIADAQLKYNNEYI
jgi:mannose-1-phosphate guanylyltransferase